MADSSKVLPVLRRASSLFRGTPGRKGGVVRLAEGRVDDVMVVGDLHGNLAAFRQVLERASLDRNTGRHLVLQELIHGRWMYPDDGGEQSHRLVELVCALKCRYPDRVHWILGNHELSELTGRPIMKDGEPLNALFRRGLETAYQADTAVVIAALHDVFRSLPLAVRTPNRVFISHTIPDGVDLDRFDTSLLDENVWSKEHAARGGTIYALTWGRDTSTETVDRFASMIDADWFVTGHQTCDEGFYQANHRQLIVDGTDPHPAYCLFPATGEIRIETIVSGARVITRSMEDHD